MGKQEDDEMRRLLNISGGRLREIGMDEKVDLAAMTRANDGKPPKFSVVKKATIESFKAKLAAADGLHRMPRLEDATDRLMAALQAGGAEVVRTNTTHSDWLRQPGPDGKISIPVERTTRRRIDKLKRPGETDEDVINRVLSPRREPSYPPGTPEYELAKEMVPVLTTGALKGSKAESINNKLQAMAETERAEFLKTQIEETLGPNDGTEAWAERLGMLMAFVQNYLSERDAKRISEEVVDKLRPVSAPVSDQRMDEVAAAAAVKVGKTLDALPHDMQDEIVLNLIDGSLIVEDHGYKHIDLHPGFTDCVTKHLAVSGKGRETIQRLLDTDNQYVRFDPEQRAKLQRYLDTGDAGPAFKVIKEKRREMRHHRTDLDREKARVDALEKQLQAMEDIVAMAKAPRLTHLGETGYHKAVQAWEDASIILPEGDRLDDDLRGAISRAATIFVVQHDWSSAFEKATDFAEGDVPLPYDDVVFEFRISGRRVCCCLRGADQKLNACILLIETSVGWALGAMYAIKDSLWNYYLDDGDVCAPILNLCRSQVRAVCIALEAKVVETEVVRAPHRLNRKRERAGKIPVFDHHIVNLANRKRYLPREMSPSDIEDEHPGKRLHFVRGHWRHYTNHKVWIRWFLRGNPDLGFVDKEYRL